MALRVVGSPATVSQSITFSLSVEQPDEAVAGSYTKFVVSALSGADRPMVARDSVTWAYDPSWHDLYWRIDFGDPGATYSVPMNVLSSWRNANVGYGREPWHVYETPGTYTATMTCIDRSGNWGQASVQVVVRDPATEWTGSNVLVVAHDGNFDGAPGTSGQRQEFTGTDLTAPLAAYRALSTPGVLYLKCGNTTSYDITDSGFGSTYPNLALLDWGTGSAPVVETTDTTDIAAIKVLSSYAGTLGSCLIRGLDLRGPWDADTETVNNPAITDKKNMGGVIFESQGIQGTVTRCKFSGFGQAIGSRASGSSTRNALCYHELLVTNWQDVGIYQATRTGSSLAILGGCVHQSAQAMMGGSGKATIPAYGSWSAGTAGNEHGAMRLQGAASLYIDGVDMFNRGGWGSNTEPPLNQACLRFHLKNPESRSYISRIAMEGGPGQFIGDAADGSLDPGNLVIDKSITVADLTSKSLGGSGLGGFTERNVGKILINTPRAGLFGFNGSLFSIGGDLSKTNAINDAAPVKQYSITALALLSDANADGVTPFYFPSDGDHFSNYTQSNTLAVAPDTAVASMVATRDVALAALSGTSLWTPRNLGVKHNPYNLSSGGTAAALTTMDGTAATPPDSAKSLQPTGSVPTIDTTAGALCAFDDIEGTPRYDPVTKLIRSSSVKGAWEPA